MGHIQFLKDKVHPHGNDGAGQSSSGDLENGDVDQEEKQFQTETAANDKGEGDEYTNLVRYIATYRDGGRRKSIASGVGDEGLGDGDQKKKKSWWPFGKKSKSADDEGFEVPDEWIETDIKNGISTSEVEGRRRKTGWNELTAEKENMFLKYLSYFRGPILYGTSL